MGCLDTVSQRDDSETFQNESASGLPLAGSCAPFSPGVGDFTVKKKSIIWLIAFTLIALLSGCAGTGHPETQSCEETVIWEDKENAERLFISHDSGVFRKKRLTVTLRAPEGFSLACTTDGSVPTVEDDCGQSELNVRLDQPSHYLSDHRDAMVCPDFMRYELIADQELPGGTVLTISLVRSDGTLSKPVSKVYFLGLDFDKLFPNCLILSIYTDPAGLLDYQTGILASGAIYDAWRESDYGQECIANAQWWKAETNSTQKGRIWERECLLQLYEGDHPGAPLTEVSAGMRVRGGVSRRMGQKSFNLYFRKEYGDAKLVYELFPGEDQYKGFALRSGGNTTENLKFKDSLLQELADDRAITVFHSRPAVLFLNGEYWGPYCLNEKLSSEMMESRFHVDKNQVIIIKEAEVEEGTDEDLLLYRELMSFAEQDMKDPAVFEAFCAEMDIQSMADYFAVRIYIGDADWSPEKNDVLWRTRDASYMSGRWQYVLYDTEYSSGLYGESSTSAAADHFQTALESYPLFAAAMQNERFRALFLDAIREIGSENYNPVRVQTSMSSFSVIWEPLMPFYYRRFGGSSYDWQMNSDSTVSFFRSRYNQIIPHVETWIQDHEESF